MATVKEIERPDPLVEWEKVQKYYSERKDDFDKNGHISALDALRWYLAYNLAEQLNDMPTRDVARMFKDSSFENVPDTIEDIIKNDLMFSFTTAEFEDFYNNYSEDEEE